MHIYLKVKLIKKYKDLIPESTKTWESLKFMSPPLSIIPDFLPYFKTLIYVFHYFPSIPFLMNKHADILLSSCGRCRMFKIFIASSVIQLYFPPSWMWDVVWPICCEQTLPVLLLKKFWETLLWGQLDPKVKKVWGRALATHSQHGSCAPLHITAAWPVISPTYLNTHKSTFLRMLTESLLVKSCSLCQKSRNKNNFAPTFFLFKGFKIAFSKYKISYSSIQHKNLCAKLQGTETFYKKLG